MSSGQCFLREMIDDQTLFIDVPYLSYLWFLRKMK